MIGGFDLPIALGILILFARSLFDVLTGAGPGFMDSMSGLVFFLLLVLLLAGGELLLLLDLRDTGCSGAEAEAALGKPPADLDLHVRRQDLLAVLA